MYSSMKHVAVLIFEYIYHIFFNLFFSRLDHFIFFPKHSPCLRHASISLSQTLMLVHLTQK